MELLIRRSFYFHGDKIWKILTEAIQIAKLRLLNWSSSTLLLILAKSCCYCNQNSYLRDLWSAQCRKSAVYFHLELRWLHCTKVIFCVLNWIKSLNYLLYFQCLYRDVILSCLNKRFLCSFDKSKQTFATINLFWNGIYVHMYIHAVCLYI